LPKYFENIKHWKEEIVSEMKMDQEFGKICGKCCSSKRNHSPIYFEMDTHWNNNVNFVGSSESNYLAIDEAILSINVIY
jgi:hypothetical protein